MKRFISTRDRGFRRMLIAGAFGAVALGAAAGPALADYYYDAPPTTEQQTTITTTTERSPSRTYVYEHERYRDRDRDHGAGVHVDTPILNFGIGIH